MGEGRAAVRPSLVFIRSVEIAPSTQLPHLHPRLTPPEKKQTLDGIMKCFWTAIRPSRTRTWTFGAAVVAGTLAGCVATTPVEPGFVNLFDGQSLAGWQPVGGPAHGYSVKDGAIFCMPAGKNLFTDREYADFILRFEFKLAEGANNGLAIRAPLVGDAAYAGMELQILDEHAANAGKWGQLRPEQYHGSVYDLIPAQRGALRPNGEWNEQEVFAVGRNLKVVLNGRTILDANLNDITDPDKLRRHPGIFRERGHIGFLGHGDAVEFRNIRIRELPRNEPAHTPPHGFVSLFNGRNLDGWQGLVADPKRRAAMSPQQRAEAQHQADQLMRRNWRIEDGTIVYRGDGYDNLCTVKNYGDFELLADWKIAPRADSGLYLRGVPQVQIWDPFTQPPQAGAEVGSGGLFNNKTNANLPNLAADRPVGEWNRFRIVMAGDNVHVFLNDQLVTSGVTLENYWDRTQPVAALGPIELQAHKTVVWFKNLYLREIEPSRR